MDEYTIKKLITPKQLEEAFKLRYQVYCHECGFLDPAAYPDGLETDEFDAHSVHFGAFNAAGKMIAYTRLILPSCSKFPIEEKSSAKEFLQENNAVREHCAEISRFMISRIYRKSCSKLALCRMVLDLTFSLLEEGRQRHLYYGFALMERCLQTLLRRYGAFFNPIGPELDFFGIVRPYVITADDFEKSRLAKARYQTH